MEKSIVSKEGGTKKFWLGPPVPYPDEYRPGKDWSILVLLADGQYIGYDPERHTQEWMNRNPDVSFKLGTTVQPEAVEVIGF